MMRMVKSILVAGCVFTTVVNGVVIYDAINSIAHAGGIQHCVATTVGDTTTTDCEWLSPPPPFRRQQRTTPRIPIGGLIATIEIRIRRRVARAAFPRKTNRNSGAHCDFANADYAARCMHGEVPDVFGDQRGEGDPREDALNERL